MKYIVAGDLHLRGDVPLCRKETPEEWLDFQSKCLDTLVTQANTHLADVVLTGDTFDVPRVPPEVLRILITALQKLLGTVWILSGNHEKAYHREDNVDKASIGIIRAIAGDNTGKIRYCKVDEKIIDGRFEHSSVINDDITVVHTLTFPNEDAIPFAANAVTADYLFDTYDTPFIFTGDMHHAFVVEKKDRWVVNPGCMTVQSAGELDYEPRMILVDTGIKTDVTVQSDLKPVHRCSKVSVKEIPFPNALDMLTREHITAAKERDARIAAAIEILQNSSNSCALSFMDELIRLLAEKDRPAMVDIILNELKQEVADGN